MATIEKIYDAKEDPQFQKPYIDIEEKRTRLVNKKEVTFTYVHGGFEDTDVKFSFCFPEKEGYKGRFFQYLSPFPGPQEELASLPTLGEDDKIGFTITHGAYFVESNMGSGSQFGKRKDDTLTWRSCAAAAEYSRTVAQRLYWEHRVYGYVYGGSGGGFKTMDCIERTNAFDGAVPYVIGSPVALPNCMTVRVHAMRLLRNKFPQVVDALEPGGSGNPYEGLNEEEAAALREATKFGYPPKSWFWYDIIGDGSLSVLGPQVGATDPGYLEDFWTVPGYLGADPDGSAVRDRLQFETKIKRVYLPKREAETEIDSRNAADDAWKKALGPEWSEKPWIELEEAPQGDDLYLTGTMVTVKSGEAAGMKMLLSVLEENRLMIGQGFGCDSIETVFQKLKPGDEVYLDNSDYIAMQTYHRHRVPAPEFTVWDQFRDENGKPLYPQRTKSLFGNVENGQSGKIQGKIIVVESLWDESALPWQADWYRKRVAGVNGGDESGIMRLWYMDHCSHGDMMDTFGNSHLVPYVGAVRQALLDVSDWVERGIAPLPTSHYTVEDGQVLIPDTAKEREGIQPNVILTVGGGKCIHVKPGEEVVFQAEIETAPDSGTVISAEWSFDEVHFREEGDLRLLENGKKAAAKHTHVYSKSGTYFAAVRVNVQRNGDREDGYTFIKNLDRVRIVVEE